MRLPAGMCLMPENIFPTIKTIYDVEDTSKANYYVGAIRSGIERLLPKNFFNCACPDKDFLDDLNDRFSAFLPICKAIQSEENPENYSFLMMGKYRINAFKFFFELVSMWLVPGKRLDVGLIFAADFKLEEFGDNVYSLCEIILHVKDPNDQLELMSNIPIIEMEARLGVESGYYARRILEIKGLSSDEKIANVQDDITTLVKKLPTYVGIDILTEMQHVMVITQDLFRKQRTSRHLARIIGIHYLFRKGLLESLKLGKEKRFLKLKLFRSKIRTVEGGEKSVLSMLIGVNFLNENEIFEKQHIMTAIHNYFPGASLVEDSYYANKRGNEKICSVYLEIEKNDGQAFTTSEMKLLYQELLVDLKDRIGHLMHPVFMPRNEEEVMRNVFSLSSQIKYMSDLPQVFITFDEQTYSHLFFTVILVRVVKPEDPSIQEIFDAAESFLEFIQDRCKMVGMIRKKYPKEANIFRVKVPIKGFLRLDNSIDLTKARSGVALELTSLIGEFRDYNGGMISKQNELLCTFRDLLLSSNIKFNDLLLENFFYSLTPVIMRTVLEPESLKTLFIMMLEAVDKGFFKGYPYTLFTKLDDQFAYAMITSQDSYVKDYLNKSINAIPRQGGTLASIFTKVYEITCVGYIYRSDDLKAKEFFCRTIDKILEAKERESFASLTVHIPKYTQT